MNRVRFMFLRDRQGAPQGCLAIQVSPNKELITYQFSVLNPIDRFDRALARDLSAGRLITAPIVVKPSKRAYSVHVITNAVMQHLSKSPLAPSRARRAAKLWLSKP